jgi:diguanylate cyclase (GGDEF)-like protein
MPGLAQVEDSGRRHGADGGGVDRRQVATLPSRVAVPILSAGGLLAIATLAVPGYVHPTWWARTTMAVMGVAALTVGVISLRRPLSARWLFGCVLGADLAIVAGVACLNADGRTNPVFFALTSVVVALYGSRRMMALQAGVATACCGLCEWLIGLSPTSAVFQAIALSFATISPALAVVALRRRLEQSIAIAETNARTDPLTQVANRRGLETGVPDLLARQERTGLPVGVAVVDIDHFKRINDQYGHAAGDHVIDQVCQVVRSCVRAEDLIVRLGGEEFAVLVLLPPADLAAMGERIRQRIADHCADRAVTASVGITWSPPGNAWTSRDLAGIWRLVDAADTLMYQAKHAGRNRVVAAAHT